jgi:hypothetical protein
MWVCPICNSKDHLNVTIETWAKLIQPDDEPEAFQTDMDAAIAGHDQEWSATSVMMCTNPECADAYETYIAEHFEADDDASVGQ